MERRTGFGLPRDETTIPRASDRHREAPSDASPRVDRGTYISADLALEYALQIVQLGAEGPVEHHRAHLGAHPAEHGVIDLALQHHLLLQQSGERLLQLLHC